MLRLRLCLKKQEMENFNNVKNYKNRNVVGNFSSVKEVIEYIKSNDREEFERIQEARKQGKGSKIYDKIKGTIPCIAINFTYNNNYINADNVSEPTGYMYIDIDEADFDIGSLDKTNVVAYWRSLSNQGYTIILKVKGLDANCLKEQYSYVAEELDIPIDFGAISVDRLTVLSYDPDVFYNPDASVLFLSQFENSQHGIKKKKK